MKCDLICSVKDTFYDRKKLDNIDINIFTQNKLCSSINDLTNNERHAKWTKILNMLGNEDDYRYLKVLFNSLFDTNADHTPNEYNILNIETLELINVIKCNDKWLVYKVDKIKYDTDNK